MMSVAAFASREAATFARPDFQTSERLLPRLPLPFPAAGFF